MEKGICNVPDCQNEVRSRGVCSSHYAKWNRYRKIDPYVDESAHDGSSEHDLYGLWAQMKNRCSNPNNSRYPWYGAKGVTVCKRWREDFWAFVSDVGKRPSDKHTLDRIDTFGDYEPGNVRWATYIEQRRNQREPVKIGKANARIIRERFATGEATTSELAREYEVEHSAIWSLLRNQSYKDAGGPIIEEEEPPEEQPSEEKPNEEEPYGISKEVALNIRERYQDGSGTLQELSREHQLGVGTVWDIVHGHSYADVGSV